MLAMKNIVERIIELRDDAQKENKIRADTLIVGDRIIMEILKWDASNLMVGEMDSERFRLGEVSVFGLVIRYDPDDMDRLEIAGELKCGMQ